MSLNDIYVGKLVCYKWCSNPLEYIGIVTHICCYDAINKKQNVIIKWLNTKDKHQTPISINGVIPLDKQK